MGACCHGTGRRDARSGKTILLKSLDRPDDASGAREKHAMKGILAWAIGIPIPIIIILYLMHVF